MLNPRACRNRQKRLLERIEGSWDAAVIHWPEHLLYLANVYPLPNSLNDQGASSLILFRDGPVLLVTDNWLVPDKEAAVDEADVRVWYDCERPAHARATLLAEAVVERLRRAGVTRIAAEAARLPGAIARECAGVVDIDPALRALRQRKDPDELEAIRRAVRTAEALHIASRGAIEPGISEVELYSRLLGPATVAASAPFVLKCDLASGPRAAQGGGPPTDRVLEAGELVILDMFPQVEGYRGDITNTLAVDGAPTREQEELFHQVQEGLHAGERLLRPGCPARDVFHAIDDLFRASPGAPRLIHHAGHGLGLGHPEAPELVPQSDATLEAGMVVTLEPGIYGKPWGGLRLEHDYLITTDGFERLSSHALGLAGPPGS